ncbi:MAG: hypothetical protein LLG20_18605 [Acidobacteriales bacterium]|nr:hypothetical protein [Terriglobales bacterium]
MKEKKEVIEQLHCFRCGFDWYPKRPGVIPTVCARCKNPRWATPRPGATDTDDITQRERNALDTYLALLRTASPKAKLLRALVEMEVSAMQGEGGR